jgi:hypothetical protein
MSWAGESPLRRLIAWLGQTVILVVIAAVGFALVWFVLVPIMIDGVVDVFNNSVR